MKSVAFPWIRGRGLMTKGRLYKWTLIVDGVMRPLPLKESKKDHALLERLSKAIQEAIAKEVIS